MPQVEARSFLCRAQGPAGRHGQGLGLGYPSVLWAPSTPARSISQKEKPRPRAAGGVRSPQPSTPRPWTWGLAWKQGQRHVKASAQPRAICGCHSQRLVAGTTLPSPGPLWHLAERPDRTLGHPLCHLRVRPFTSGAGGGQAWLPLLRERDCPGRPASHPPCNPRRPASALPAASR